MPSRVTFISVPNGNVDVERSFEEVNVTSSMVELNKDERVKKISAKETLEMLNNGERNFCGLNEKEIEKVEKMARQGRRSTLTSQIFNSRSQQCRRKISLHGKAIYFTAPSKRKSRRRMWKFAIYNFLERPDSSVASILYLSFVLWQTKVYNFLDQPKGLELVYHLITFLFVLGCVILSVLATIPDYREMAGHILFYVEIAILILFSVEFGLRLWSAGCRCKYQGFFGALRFCRKPFSIIDMVVILSSLIVICLGSQGNVFATTAMRGLRFLQILRMVRMDRRGGTWKLLSSVVKAHSKELITAWYIGFLTLIFASFLVYQVEKEENSKEFETYADALWWGMITLTTIGYGDKVPKTWAGRLVASAFSIVGISFFALPAGILGSGFALKVQEQNRQKHFARRRMPAAYLIQCLWRCYAADKNSRSVATWLPHLRARLNQKNTKDPYLSSHESPKYGRRTNLRNRFTTKTSVTSATCVTSAPLSFHDQSYVAGDKIQVPKSHSLADRISDKLTRHNSLRAPRKDKVSSEKKMPDPIKDQRQTNSVNEFVSSSSDSESDNKVLSEQHKDAVRSIRMMKFLVAKRKFKEALRPYDVKDVIEQYSSGHVEMLARIKNLQNRVDMILGISTDPITGNPPSYYYRSIRSSVDTQSCLSAPALNASSMNSRLLKVEAEVENVDRKLDLILNLLSENNSSFDENTNQNFGKKNLKRFYSENPNPIPRLYVTESIDFDDVLTSEKPNFSGEEDLIPTFEKEKPEIRSSKDYPSFKPASEWNYSEEKIEYGCDAVSSGCDSTQLLLTPAELRATSNNEANGLGDAYAAETKLAFDDESTPKENEEEFQTFCNASEKKQINECDVVHDEKGLLKRRNLDSYSHGDDVLLKPIVAAKENEEEFLVQTTNFENDDSKHLKNHRVRALSNSDTFLNNCFLPATNQSSDFCDDFSTASRLKKDSAFVNFGSNFSLNHYPSEYSRKPLPCSNSFSRLDNFKEVSKSTDRCSPSILPGFSPNRETV